MTRTKRAVKQLYATWPRISEIISVIHSPAQYEKAVTFLDALIDEVGENEKHSLAPLMELLGVLIENYEDAHLKEPKGDPVSVLRFLMQEHEVRQVDLPEVGSQGVVSEILKRKRKLNVRQIQALSKKFNISPAVFMEN